MPTLICSGGVGVNLYTETHDAHVKPLPIAATVAILPLEHHKVTGSPCALPVSQVTLVIFLEPRRPVQTTG